MSEKYCQKCSQTKPAHDVYQCSMCKQNCCNTCLERAETIHSPINCQECAVRRRWFDENARQGRVRLKKTDHQPGQKVWWQTLGGGLYHGVFKEWDNGTAIVIMPDGREKGV